jgi:hypothetical protein
VGAFDADLWRAFIGQGGVSTYDLEDAALAELDGAIRPEPGHAARLRRGSPRRRMSWRPQDVQPSAGGRERDVADLSGAIRPDPGGPEADFERGECRPGGNDGMLGEVEIARPGSGRPEPEDEQVTRETRLSKSRKKEWKCQESIPMMTAA